MHAMTIQMEGTHGVMNEKNYQIIHNERLPSKHSAFTTHNCSSVQSMIYMDTIHPVCIQWNLASFEVTQKFKPLGHDFKYQTQSLHCLHNTIPSLQNHLLCILYSGKPNTFQQASQGTFPSPPPLPLREL